MDNALQQEAVTVSPAEPAGMHVRVCLVGGQRIVRSAIQEFLQSQGMIVAETADNHDALGPGNGNGNGHPFELIVLILTGGAFRSFYAIREVVELHQSMPLVVLSDQVSRGQVYTALRMGAKALVNLNADPNEMLAAIRTAALHKVYLSPEAAELLVSDISTSIKPSRGSRLAAGSLSKRETEIVQMLCEGLSSKEIARSLHLSAKTIENHRYNIYRKCEVDSIAGLIRHAIQQGMVSI